MPKFHKTLVVLCIIGLSFDNHTPLKGLRDNEFAVTLVKPKG
jgi:hypothetical protein